MKRSDDDLVLRIAITGLLSVLLCDPFYSVFIKDSVDAMWMSGYKAWQISDSTAGPLVVRGLLLTLCAFAAVLGVSFWLANEVVKSWNWLQGRWGRRVKTEAGETPPAS